MTMDIQSWMRAVWSAIVEPSASAQKVIALGLPRDALWTALGLITVLNVILLALLQMVSPAPIVFEEQVFTVSPFGYATVLGVFLLLFVMGMFYAGKAMGGAGTLLGALTIVVWFQSISLTLETIQLGLLLISPAAASIFGMLSLGALLWCILNFVNVLHGFENLGKSAGVLLLSLVGTAVCALVILTTLGLVPSGGLT